MEEQNQDLIDSLSREKRRAQLRKAFMKWKKKKIGEGYKMLILYAKKENFQKIKETAKELDKESQEKLPEPSFLT